MTLTREQKIKRAVNRINNRTNKELPLIAPLIQTTEEEQEQRYDAIDKSHEEYVSKLDALEADMLRRGREYREQAIRLYSADDMQRMDQYFTRVLGELSHAYCADYWRKAVERKKCVKQEAQG